ncbi:MAG TPA: hypothetical protein VKB78_06295 [Pirellulales bacterium]|nr:hypothetical protein [Pirellulales bacterium]
MTHAELEAGLDAISQSPKDGGRVEMIVRRPRTNEREVLEVGEIDLVEGLAGDKWRFDGSSTTLDGSADPDAQITIMNSRAIDLIAGGRDRWAIAGDQLYIDLDLSQINIPPGTRLAIGEAEIELTAKPHTGCGSFKRRFGGDATKFVNSPLGRQLQLRGVNAKVIKPGAIRVGDIARKTAHDHEDSIK